MKMKLALLALVAMQTSVLAGGTYSCWTSEEAGGVLMCGTAADSHVATAEEIMLDRNYRIDTQKYGQTSVSLGIPLDELIKWMPKLEADRILADWPVVQAKSQEKVAVFLDAQQGGVVNPNPPKK